MLNNFIYNTEFEAGQVSLELWLNSSLWLFESSQSQCRATSHGPANLSQQVLLKPQKRKHETTKCVIPAINIYPEPIWLLQTIVTSW